MSLVETATMDNIIATNAHPLTAQTVIVASGEGKLTRGTILARNEDDEFQIAGTEDTVPEVILATDVDATDASAVAEAYNSGDFFTNKLIVADNYTITEADILALKNAGIYLVSGIA